MNLSFVDRAKIVVKAKLHIKYFWGSELIRLLVYVFMQITVNQGARSSGNQGNQGKIMEFKSSQGIIEKSGILLILGKNHGIFTWPEK